MRIGERKSLRLRHPSNGDSPADKQARLLEISKLLGHVADQLLKIELAKG